MGAATGPVVKSAASHAQISAARCVRTCALECARAACTAEAREGAGAAVSVTHKIACLMSNFMLSACDFRGFLRHVATHSTWPPVPTGPLASQGWPNRDVTHGYGPHLSTNVLRPSVCKRWRQVHEPSGSALRATTSAPSSRRQQRDGVAERHAQLRVSCVSLWCEASSI